jgi:YebC/PmpR family DNA-binding regulatory protein
MGAQWKVSAKSESANKKGAIFTKLAKEIGVAAKLGDPDPANNPRLRAAVEAAKKASMPRDTIERNIKKGAGLLGEPMNYETVYYEGFAPNKVPVIIECLTDNRNRTASDIRSLFRKGQLGNAGSVAWMFDRLGVVEATKEGTADIEEAAIEANAQNVEPLDKADVPAGHTGGRFFTDPTDLDAVSKYLIGKGWNVTTSELSYIAKNAVELAGPEKAEVVEFLSEIDDHDDVHRLYTAVKN